MIEMLIKYLFQTKNHMAQISQWNISLDISTMIGNKTMSFKVRDEKLTKKCTKIWKKVTAQLIKKIGSEPVYGDNDKNMKTKIESYGDKIQILKVKKC